MYQERVSVVATVLNEADAIGRLVESLRGQTRLPDEIVIVDGGSSDGTWEQLQAFASDSAIPWVLLEDVGCNISRGRNVAIAAARGPIIAITDAGVRLEPDWLERLVEPFASQDPPDVVSGFFVPESESLFEMVLGAITLPAAQEIDPNTFHPSSRSVALRRHAWQAVGGYPEWLDYCEDLLFDFSLRDAGFGFAFAEQAIVHFRPRPNLRAFCRQYYRYARGDGKADLWRWRHLVRYGAYLILMALIIMALAQSAWWWLGVAFVVSGLARGPIQRLRPFVAKLTKADRVRAVLWAPALRICGDLAKMAGYPVGVVWRWRHAPKKPWPKRQW